jgi:hypothetical protein
MPDKTTLQRAKKDKREGKAPSTQAGEFVREEIEHIREGKHGARSTKQAIAIGLSKARRGGRRLAAAEGRHGLGEDAPERGERVSSRAHRRSRGFAHPIARNEASAETRRPCRCVEESAGQAGARGSGEKACIGALRGSAQGRDDKG